MNASSHSRTIPSLILTLASFGVATALGASAAGAADMVEATPEPAPVVESLPVATWTGPYAGVNLGYGWSNDEVGGVDVDGDGVLGGVFAGYNMQSGMLVYGAEAELGYSGVSGEEAGVSTHSGFEGSLRARLGVAPTDRTLIYATGGVAAKQLEASAGGVSDDKGVVGYTVGGGAEIKFTQNVFGRAEYRFSDYGSRDYDLGGPVGVDSQDHRVTFGVGMNF